jgi:predicted metal-dependent hydrolase
VQHAIHVDPKDQQHRQSWLGEQLVCRVTVVWTDNRSSMLSVKGNASTGYHVRLHRMFCQAPDIVWHALVAYVRHTDAAARQTLRTYIQHHRHLIRQPSSRRQRTKPLQAKGHHFDLEAIYRELNQTYFANRVQACITWSRQPPKRLRTSIRFGSYHAEDRLIRIHRLLDQSFVPRYVIENVVFHEMLHQLIPRQRVNGRWCIHSPEFRRQEQRFPYHRQAEEWKRRHLNRLLRGRGRL